MDLSTATSNQENITHLPAAVCFNVCILYNYVYHSDLWLMYNVMDNIVYDKRESLVPSRKGSLNIRTSTSNGHLRHTSRSLDDSPTLVSTFEATAVHPSQSRQTFHFLPLSTLLRAHVPISWLSNHFDPRRPPPGTLLRATISTVSRWDYRVLVARLAANDDLHVFEKVEADVFTCYPLQSWVKPRWIELAAVGAAPPVDLDLWTRSQDHHDHFRKISVSSNNDNNSHISTPTSPKLPRNRRGHLARKSILDTRESADDTRQLDDTPIGDDHAEHSYSQTKTSQSFPFSHDAAVKSTDSHLCARRSEEPTSELVPESILERGNLSVTTGNNEATIGVAHVDPLSSEHLRRQYLETLYVSKTSLAFYAKGPLSRARARARVADASRSPEQLADFYRESILPRKKMDVKYKESVHKQIQAFVARENIDNSNDLSAQQSRKSRRTKLGKDALWPIENEYIARWWRERDTTRAPVHTSAARTDEAHQAIAAIRLREIELQIILILETLALETRDVAKQQTAKATTPDVKYESTEHGDRESLGMAATTKKKRDLKSELDFLVDRMCILHSIGLEDVASGPGPANTGTASPDKTRNKLQDFCKDVVVPFYGGKLPAICQVICNKMGGPEVMPRRHKDSHEREQGRRVSAIMAPGESTSSKRSFERIVGDDQGRRHFSPPSFARSSTLPISSTVKREPSERPISRSGLQKSASFSNREVDLVADARVTAMKRRKLDLVAAQKRELDAAIENLKRPNRSTVARSFMEDAEQRTAAKKPATKKVEPIQISATPTRGMAKYIQIDDYDLPPMTLEKVSGEHACIPSSTVKPRGLKHNASFARPSAQKKAVLSAIHDTPSKPTPTPSHRKMTQDKGEPNQASSAAVVACTPSTTRLRLDLDPYICVTPMQMNRSHKHVVLTPLERSEASVEEAFKDIPEIPERAGKMMDRVMGAKASAADMSIYESLGWDDYDL